MLTDNRKLNILGKINLLYICMNNYKSLRYFPKHFQNIIGLNKTQNILPVD